VKKLIAAIVIIFLPMMSVAGEVDFDQFYVIEWLSAEYTDLNFSVSDIDAEADYQSNVGFGLSAHIPIGIFGIYADIGGQGSGYDFSKWEISLNLSHQFIWGFHIFAGPNYTSWSFAHALESNPGFGFQSGIEYPLSFYDGSILGIQTGYKYNAGTAKHTNINISSNAFFFRIGMYIGI